VEPDHPLELERCRRELTEAREQLGRAHEHLSLLAGQIGHDLRTPLTAVLANAEMLSGEKAVTDDEELSWMVAGIIRGAQRMNEMIEQMLVYAGEGGGPSLADTALDEVFALVVEDLASVIAEKQAEVEVGPLPSVRADAGQMYAVAGNLLSNAIDFARPGTPPRVEVAAERRDGCWRVELRDNGVGVSPAQREAMFVLFARADKRSGGRGIGLAAAKRVVEAHGGRIGMDGASGGGTTVWFELPA